MHIVKQRSMLELWVITDKGNAWTILHYCDVIMEAMASQIVGLTIVYSIVHSGADQRKHQSSASLKWCDECIYFLSRHKTKVKLYIIQIQISKPSINKVLPPPHKYPWAKKQNIAIWVASTEGISMNNFIWFSGPWSWIFVGVVDLHVE